MHTVDVMHVLQYIYQAGECLYKEGSAELQGWVNDQKELLYNGKEALIVARMKRRLDALPATGPGMLVGNHSGGVPADGGMVIGSLFFSLDPPRHVHGMVEKFAQEWPFVSQWFNRVGQLPGLPEHAIRLLQDGRLLMVFPEGARGLGKLYKDRYHLTSFGTGINPIQFRAVGNLMPTPAESTAVMQRSLKAKVL